MQTSLKLFPIFLFLGNNCLAQLVDNSPCEHTIWNSNYNCRIPISLNKEGKVEVTANADVLRYDDKSLTYHCLYAVPGKDGNYVQKNEDVKVDFFFDQNNKLSALSSHDHSGTDRLVFIRTKNSCYPQREEVIDPQGKRTLKFDLETCRKFAQQGEKDLNVNYCGGIEILDNTVRTDAFKSKYHRDFGPKDVTFAMGSYPLDSRLMSSEETTEKVLESCAKSSAHLKEIASAFEQVPSVPPLETSILASHILNGRCDTFKIRQYNKELKGTSVEFHAGPATIAPGSK